VNDPVGVVLAGGASRRMGRDKATLELAGEPLAAAAARRLAAVCPLVVVADRGRGTVPGRTSLADGPGEGPAAGLLGAARAWPGRPLLALACDLPGVPVPLLAELTGPGGIDLELAPVDLVIPRWSGGLEPLCALWGAAALTALAERVARGLYALHSLVEEGGLAVRFLEGERLTAFGRPEAMFRNLNRPEDLSLFSP
jgi:molybdopterin-guanine dinucleotide biosynthesis protein A